VAVILDAGALIALERSDRAMWARMKAAVERELPVVTHAGVVGQVWRGGARQALLARALRGVDVVPLDEELGRAAGVLLSASGGSDVIDAAVVLLAEDGNDIVTSDAGDLTPLAVASRLHVELVHV
jgi:hypothetical protein